MGALVNKQRARARSSYAFLIYMLPQGIFSVAVSTVLFPTLSRQAARARPGGDAQHARQRHAPDQPAADPLRGRADGAVACRSRGWSSSAAAFRRSRSHLTSEALFWFAWSLPFAGLNLLMTRTFFALQRPWLPTKLAAINMTVDIVVSVALYKPLGIAGLVIGTASANIVMAVLQLRRLRIGFNGRLDLGQTAMISVRILIVVGAHRRDRPARLGAAQQHRRRLVAGQIVSVGGAVLLAAGFYVWAISHMRIPEWQQIESMLLEPPAAERERPRTDPLGSRAVLSIAVLAGPWPRLGVVAAAAARRHGDARPHGRAPRLGDARRAGARARAAAGRRLALLAAALRPPPPARGDRRRRR